mgnify:CR=1 FL=1
MKRYNFVTVHKVTIFNAKPRGGKIMYAMYFVAVGSLAALLFVILSAILSAMIKLKRRKPTRKSYIRLLNQV